MRTKLYKIKGTLEYANAQEVYCNLPDCRKSKIENLVSKEIYSALVFDIYVLDNIENTELHAKINKELEELAGNFVIYKQSTY